jgi:predicted short-subunit dehydrogenase-like oxidoreductase (DUF2520 family)
MRELERKPSADDNPSCPCLAIIGQGRVGTALAAALGADPPAGGRNAAPVGPVGDPAAGGRRTYAIRGPLGRGADDADADAVLLCVPDHEIAAAAAVVAPGPLVGHCSGATPLAVLEPHEAFSLHPLMTVTGAGTTFEGAGAAIAGTTPRALGFAQALADALAMKAVEVEDRDRAAYHAAASIASNFMVTLEAAAERVARSAGVERELLLPLVRATVENWAAMGPERALTGPVARGDRATVAAQRAAVAERAGDLLPLFDTLVQHTRALARSRADGNATSPGAAAA